MLIAENTMNCILQNSVQNPNIFIYYTNVYVMIKNKGLFLQHYVFAPRRSVQIEDCSICLYIGSLE